MNSFLKRKNTKNNSSSSNLLKNKQASNTDFELNKLNRNETANRSICVTTTSAAVVTPNGHVVAQEDPEDEQYIINLEEELYKTPKKHRHLKKKLF